MPPTNAAIFILTRNTEARKAHLKTCLYFLFKHFNAEHGYPVRIFHEGDYDAEAMREVVLGVRASCRHLVSFVAMDPAEWELPEWIDADRVQRVVELKVVPYWRDVRYRLMCRWWLVHMPRHAKGYDYVMRLDDDSIIEESIGRDLFEWAEREDLTYVSNLVHLDCGVCCYGMRDFFEGLFPDRKDTLDSLFVPSTVPAGAYVLPQLRAFLSLDAPDKPPAPFPETGLVLQQPVIAYNNFFITKTSFWQREDVQKTIGAVDLDGRIFYARWGDAPLHTIIAALHAREGSVQRAVFAYSKRMQREAFPGDDGCWHAFMPATYDHTSSIA